MKPRVHFITLIVADLERAKRFYVEGLGWPAALEAPHNVAMIHVGEKLVLSLWSESAAREEVGPVSRGGTLPFTLAHNVASTEEVTAVLEDARRAGATVHEAQKRDWGGTSGYFVDPDGFRWEVAHNPFPVGDVMLP